MNNNFSSLSPTKQICTMGSGVTGNKNAERENQSSMLGWIQSPFYPFDCLSPEGSTMSFTITSPSCQIPVYDHDVMLQNDYSSFSPSIFSPLEKLLRSKDLRKESSSTSDILGNASLPITYSLLDSPHNNLFENYQTSLMHKNIHTDCLEHQRAHNSFADDEIIGIAIDGQKMNDETSSNNYIPVETKKYKLKKLSSNIRSSNKKSPQSVTTEIESNQIDISNKLVNKNKVKIPKSNVGKSTVRKKKDLMISPDSSFDSSLISVKEDSPNFSVPFIDFQLTSGSAISELGSTVKKIAKCSVSSAVKLTKQKQQQKSNISQNKKSDILFIKTSPSSLEKNTASKTDHTGPVCNCKKSKCLKLYCDCFAILNYCNPDICNCIECCNISSQEAIRLEAIKITKDRNNLAFQTKINEKEQHSTGCHCKNSQCLKKYCECYTGSAFCGVNCKCKSCMNFDGSTELIKARNSALEMSEGLNLSKKRKESPSSVSFLDNNNTLNEENIKLPPPFPSIGNYDTFDNNLISLDKANTTFMDLTNSNISISLLPSTSTTSSLVHVAKNVIRKTTNKKITIDKLNNPNEKPNLLKKKTVKFQPIPIVYPFFGSTLPMTSKLVALTCLDYLEGKDIYSMSQVSSLWAKAAMDDALWE